MRCSRPLRFDQFALVAQLRQTVGQLDADIDDASAEFFGGRDEVPGRIDIDLEPIDQGTRR